MCGSIGLFCELTLELKLALLALQVAKLVERSLDWANFSLAGILIFSVAACCRCRLRHRNRSWVEQWRGFRGRHKSCKHLLHCFGNGVHVRRAHHRKVVSGYKVDLCHCFWGAMIRIGCAQQRHLCPGWWRMKYIRQADVVLITAHLLRNGLAQLRVTNRVEHRAKACVTVSGKGFLQNF